MNGGLETLLGEYAWYQKNAGAYVMPTGVLKPNDLGLFDMLGNAMELCQNNWKAYRSLVMPISGLHVLLIKDN